MRQKQAILKGKNIYLVGIKGAGMAGLAQILKGLGYHVSGSDIKDTFFTDEILRRAEIPFYEGFEARNIPADIDWAVSSGAYLVEKSKILISPKAKWRSSNPKSKTTGQKLKVKKDENVEIQELKKKGVPIVSYSEALGYFFNQAFGIVVTGTHGKSTTAAMIAYILEQGGKDPFALIGGELLNWHSNARTSQKAIGYKLKAKSYFVIEADEYREQFLHYKPNVLVITNIDYDHPDYFATKKSYRNAFEKIKKQVKKEGIIIEGKNIDLSPTTYDLRLIGEHNQQNALLAYETCKALGVDHKTIKNAFASFKGLRRRLERVGEYSGAIIIDDYAHHPQEIIASLSAIKNHNFSRGREESYEKNLIVLFHPHTYSRTKKFLKEFAKALTLADEIYLLDIYASAREKSADVSSNDIIREIQALGRDAINLHTIESAVKYLRNYLKKGDIFVTMGAGDVFRVAYRLLEKN